MEFLAEYAVQSTHYNQTFIIRIFLSYSIGRLSWIRIFLYFEIIFWSGVDRIRES